MLSSTKESTCLSIRASSPTTKGGKFDRWLARQLLEDSEVRSTPEPVFRVDLTRAPVSVPDDLVEQCWAAGWPYADRRRDELVLAGMLDRPSTSMQLFWRLELEHFERPTEVGFHTMWCRLEPEGTVGFIEDVRDEVFGRLRSPGRRWGNIVTNLTRRVGNVTIYRYRIDFEQVG